MSLVMSHVMSLVVARNVARDVVRNVVRGVSRGVSRDVGRMRQYEHLTGAGSPPLFYISHNLSVEMGDFTDKLYFPDFG